MNYNENWYDTEDGIRKYYENETKERALRGSFTLCNHILQYKVEIYMMDDEGNVIRQDTFDELWKAEHRMGEWVSELYEKGLENTHSISYVKTDVREYTYFVPSQMLKWKDETTRIAINEHYKRRDQQQRKEERNKRWREGCEWAKSKGARIRLDLGVKRRTLIKHLVKLNLVDEWNEKYPEFEIKEGDVILYTEKN